MSMERVVTKYGPVVGAATETGYVFKGIPYAAPPVGERRFAAPAEPECWTQDRICDTWPADCYKVRMFPSNPRRAVWEPDIYTLSEDCLYLNVWTPARSAGEKLPVMVWLYGASGSSHDAHLDGAELNKRGCILITINYRYEVFGDFGLEEFADRDPENSTGAYEIMDIVAALRWVRDNAGAFGGDPANVTVFGHSAGAMFTKLLLSCKPAWGLFKRIISLSGAGIVDIDTVHTRQEKVDFCKQLLEKAGWTAEDLMTRPTEEVYGTMKKYEKELELPKASMINSLFHPSMEDCYITDYYGQNLYDGEVDEGVDIMCGMLGEEWHNCDVQVPGGLGDYQREFAISPVLAWARRYNQRGIKPIYTYFFERPMPGDEGMMRHGDELPYVFGTLDRYKKNWGEFDRQLSQTVLDYFAAFARTGDPNVAGRPEWKPFSEQEPETMVFGDGEIGTKQLVREERMDAVVQYMLKNPGMGMMQEPFL